MAKGLRRIPAVSRPGGLHAQAHISISRFVSRKDLKDSGSYCLLLWSARVRSKIRAFDVLTSGVGKGGEGEDPTTPLVIQMVPVACWEQPGSVTDPTCGFNYSAWRGDAAEWKERGRPGRRTLCRVGEQITNNRDGEVCLWTCRTTSCFLFSTLNK